MAFKSVWLMKAIHLPSGDQAGERSGPGLLVICVRCAPLSVLLAATMVLSGDHSKSSTPWGVSVRWVASPPRRLRSQTWVLPLFREERKARYLPSGLQRGCEEETPSAVMEMGSPPWVETIQRRCSFLSS